MYIGADISNVKCFNTTNIDRATILEEIMPGTVEETKINKI